MAKFHDSEFDEATLLKLEIFRGYIREWIPVFLTKNRFSHIHIYDFFAGPGTDKAGKPGSPIIIIEELKKYLADPKVPKATGVDITLYFNDKDKAHIDSLHKSIESLGSTSGFSIELSNLDFPDAYQKKLPELKSNDSAKLVLLDQCGIKQVNDHVFKELIECPTTDILFFISSGIIHRFISEGSIRQYFPMPEEEIKSIKRQEIHRYICRSFYERLIPSGQTYYLAPFSILKGTNIYGIIYGSSNFLGLQKFLKVCWNEDEVTGEANYDIDDDPIRRDGQAGLFPEFNIIKKQDTFRQDMINFLKSGHKSNNNIYRFTLENGFLPKHVNDLFRQFQREGKLIVSSPVPGIEVPKGAFYISWDYYKDKQYKARFEWKKD
ncbi:MAG: hypothetical protein A2X48_07460 [Lentisphaerae bacterium GWF2_49_21]|nr:MAG: hypothetical protein A2X48_07460 [Lentisphaerae bacterium GWF2_49_21]